VQVNNYKPATCAGGNSPSRVCAKLVCAYKGERERVNAVALSYLAPVQNCTHAADCALIDTLCFAPSFVVTFDLQLLYPADSHTRAIRAAQNLICQSGMQLFANSRKLNRQIY
jgi:hypothetical protein